MNAPLLRFRVLPGLRARTVRVRIARDQATAAGALAAAEVDAAPLAHVAAEPRELLDAFLRGVEVGCLGAVPSGTALTPQPLAPTPADSPDEVCFLVALPPLPEGALQVLGNMANASVPLGSGITRLAVEETLDPLPAAHASLDLATLAPPVAPFPVRRTDVTFGKELGILATFRRALDPQELGAVTRAVRAWEGLALGGFPAPDLPGLSMTRLLKVTSHLDDEVVVDLEMFVGGLEAWDAVVRGFVQLHRDVSSVACLEIG